MAKVSDKTRIDWLVVLTVILLLVWMGMVVGACVEWPHLWQV